MTLLLFAVVGGVLVIALAVLLWRWGKQPYVHRAIGFDRLHEYLHVLLHRGYPGGVMTLRPTDEPGDRFLQFAKYVDDEGRAGIEFGFPLAPWSEEYYEPFKETLRRQGVDYRVEKTGREDTREFLTVYTDSDLELAERLVRIGVVDVFGLPQETTLDLWYEGVSPREETIGRVA